MNYRQIHVAKGSNHSWTSRLLDGGAKPHLSNWQVAVDGEPMQPRTILVVNQKIFLLFFPSNPEIAVEGVFL